MIDVSIAKFADNNALYDVIELERPVCRIWHFRVDIQRDNGGESRLFATLQDVNDFMKRELAA